MSQQQAALERLDSEGVSWQAVDHGISWTVYFADPDGNGLELYVDRRGLDSGRLRWDGVTERLSRASIRTVADPAASLGIETVDTRAS